MYKIIGTDGKEYGPVSLEQLRQWRDEGRINQDTRVLAEGETDWKKLGALPAFTSQPSAPANGLPDQIPGFRPMSAQPRRVNSYAIAGLVLGLISLPLAFCCAGVPFNLLGIVFSAIALTQIKDQPEVYSGRGIAIGGIVSAILGLIWGLVWLRDEVLTQLMKNA